MGHRLPRFNPHLARPTPVEEWFDPRTGRPEAEVAATLLKDIAPLLKRSESLGDAYQRPAFGWSTVGADTPGAAAPQFIGEVFDLQRLFQFHCDAAVLHLAGEEPAAAAWHLDRVIGVSTRLANRPPALVGALIAMVNLRRATDVIQEGVIRGAWSPRQLETFERHLASIAVGEGFRQAMRIEVAFAATALSSQLATGAPRDEIDWLDGWEPDPATIAGRIGEIWSELRPTGSKWKDQLEALEIWVAEIQHQGRLDRGDLERIEQQMATASEAAHDAWYAILMGPGKGAAQLDCELKLARAGIALERFRLARGHHPGRLAELVPDFLDEVPPDPWSDTGTICYHRIGGDGVQLWSVGRDGIDEGGLPHNDPDRGDEVWLTRPIPGFTEADLRR